MSVVSTAGNQPLSTRAGAASPSVARRTALMAGAGILLVLGVVAVTLSMALTRQAEHRVQALMSSEAASVARVAGAFRQAAEDSATRLYAILAEGFDGPFTLNGEGKLLVAGKAVADDFTVVDRFARTTGGVATVFARQGDDFLRVSTSLKKPDGSRAVGTALGAKHPAHAKLMQGGEFVGSAVLFGTPYMTRYTPVKDAGGQVVAVLFVGFDMTSLRRAQAEMAAGVKLFDSGGVYLLDPADGPDNAVLQAHPQAKGRKLAEWLSADQARAWLTALQASGEGGTVPGATAVLDKADEDPIVVTRRDAGTGWWVVAEVSRTQALAELQQSLWLLWVGVLATAALLGAGLWALLKHWVGRPLLRLNEAAAAVAAGDLTSPVQACRNDDLGSLARAMEAMRLNLAGTIGEVRGACSGISTASAEIAAGGQDLSQRTEEAASQLQQTAASMEHIAGSVHHAADAAHTAQQLAAAANESARRGATVMASVVATMGEINTSSQRIGEIIGTINAISFQTNLLALNAAVEAARAGEQGRGFAVVAAEVRNLAKRSADAASEIKQLVGNSVESVGNGNKLVGEAGSAMTEIEASVKRVADVIGEISAHSREQAEGVASVNTAVGQLDEVTQQNAALVEQSAAAAESLRDQSERLVQQVQRFRTGEANLA